MGVAVSNWRLAKAVSCLGQLGVVSGTALDTVLIRNLQDGDPKGHIRRALAAFPIEQIGQRILDKYFLDGGRKAGQPYACLPMPTFKLSNERQGIIMAASFVEVFLAKEGHSGPIGLNLLEKVQIPTLPSLFGAMLANVDYVLVGAGIPFSFPEVLDRLSKHLPAELKLNVQGSTTHSFRMSFSPQDFFSNEQRDLIRPFFLPIVSSAVLASSLLKHSNGVIDGFVVEHFSAGGHNAPPRGPMTLTPSGEPIYGERDEPDFEKFRGLAKPFWLAGSYGSREGLKKAQSLGAIGIQVGTAFAYCEESGIPNEIKAPVFRDLMKNELSVFTNPRASPTGFPFKVVSLAQSLSVDTVYEQRSRICDLGYLRTAYLKDDGNVGYRCPGEDVSDFVRKGGSIEETKGRMCLCNGLLSTVGLGQLREGGYYEPSILTSGDDIQGIETFMHEDHSGYTAADVVQSILR